MTIAFLTAEQITAITGFLGVAGGLYVQIRQLTKKVDATHVMVNNQHDVLVAERDDAREQRDVAQQDLRDEKGARNDG